MSWELLKRRIIRLEAQKPAALAHLLTTQAIPNTGTHIVNFSTVVRDTHNAITIGSSWRYTIPAGQTGYYLVDCHFRWAAIASASAPVHEVYVDAARVARLSAGEAATAGATNIPGTAVVYAAGGSFIDVRAEQNSATGNRNIDPASIAGFVRIEIVKIA